MARPKNVNIFDDVKIDKINMNHQIVCFGEILFDIIGETTKPGGAPLNVAYHLKQGGIDSFLISSVGNDAYGRGLVGAMKEWRLDARGIEIDDTHQTGVAVVHYDENDQPTFELVYPVAWDYIPWKDEYAQIIKNAGTFLFGSLASRNEESYATLKECLKYSSLNVFDINVRPPHFNRPILEEMLQHTHILKLNSDELVLLSNWYGSQNEEESAQVAAIRKRFQIEEVLITKGEYGASYYSDEVELHQPAIKIKVVDTVGSGDAFLAGFLSRRIDRSSSIQECLMEGLRRGSYVASQHGACPSYEGYSEKNYFSA